MLGCNIGQSVIPIPTGLYPLYNSLNSEWYNGTPIHIVTWSGDPICGINNNQFNFIGKSCIAGSNFRHGNVIEYNEADLNCNLPLDGSLILLLPIVIFGYFKIKNR